jgi:membrane protein DedA with SNARE-associated domain
MNTIIDFLAHYHSAGLFILLILGGVGLPFPEDATLILCGILISQHLLHLVRALVTVYLGLLCADSIVFHIGKKYGRRIVTHRRFQRFLSPHMLTELEGKFCHRGVWFIFIGRHLAGLRIQIFLVAGAMRMPYLKFIAADAISSLFTLALMVGIGYVGGSSWEILRKDITRIEHMALLCVSALATGYVLYKYFRTRRSSSL